MSAWTNVQLPLWTFRVAEYQAGSIRSSRVSLIGVFFFNFKSQVYVVSILVASLWLLTMLI